MRLLNFLSIIFRKTPNGLPSVFWNFATESMLKNLKGPLLQFSALWDFSKGIIFVLKLGFLRPSTLYPIFVFFKDRCFFYAISKFVFIEAPSIFTKNETFCERKGLLNVFGTIRLTGDQHQKSSENFKKNFLSFLFLKVFRWERWVFCCFQLGKNGFRDLCVSLRVFFGAVKLMKF